MKLYPRIPVEAERSAEHISIAPRRPKERVPVRRAPELEPLSADRCGVHFSADAELRDLIERARLRRADLPNGDLAGLTKLTVASIVRQEGRRRFGIATRPRRIDTKTQTESSSDRKTPPGGVAESSLASGSEESASRAQPPAERGRSSLVEVRRAAHSRDRARCAFVSADGRRCSARAFLEFDHVEPFTRFGLRRSEHRLLRKAHNLLHAGNSFGAEHLAVKVAARKLSPQASA